MSENWLQDTLDDFNVSREMLDEAFMNRPRMHYPIQSNDVLGVVAGAELFGIKFGYIDDMYPQSGSIIDLVCVSGMPKTVRSRKSEHDRYHSEYIYWDALLEERFCVLLYGAFGFWPVRDALNKAIVYMATQRPLARADVAGPT